MPLVRTAEAVLEVALVEEHHGTMPLGMPVHSEVVLCAQRANVRLAAPGAGIHGARPAKQTHTQRAHISSHSLLVNSAPLLVWSPSALVLACALGCASSLAVA